MSGANSEDASAGGGRDGKKQGAMSDYGSPEYWEARYQSFSGDGTMTFDWYQDYHQLKAYLKPFLHRRTYFSVLIPGCGNSRKCSDAMQCDEMPTMHSMIIHF